MKQRLQFKVSQRLAVPLQLQQTLQLLSLPTLELRQQLQVALETNPVLEMEAVPRERLEAEEPGDAGTEEILWNNASRAASRADPRDYAAAPEPSLRHHLLRQLAASKFDGADHLIAFAIIDAIESSGQLGESLEAVQKLLSGELSVPLEQLEKVLLRIQREFEPTGIGFRNLRECLLRQLESLPTSKACDNARQLVDRHLELLADNDMEELRRVLGLEQPALTAAVKLVRSLDPHPGYTLSSEPPEYIVPDLVVLERDGQRTIELSPGAPQGLFIRHEYSNLRGQQHSSAKRQFLKNYLTDARQLIRALAYRNDTLLRIARCILEVQADFFVHGEEKLRPLGRADVSERLELHESTISRAANGKYVHTARGIYELRFFFSSRLRRGNDPEGVSGTATRAMIARLIEAEDPEKPLSDNQIARHLKARQDISVARRTVAKYRQALAIPSSNKRRYHTQGKFRPDTGQSIRNSD